LAFPGRVYINQKSCFDRLRKLELLTAERFPANGPYRYVLPESLTLAANRFSELPQPVEWSRQFAAPVE
jgi:hypothetical protein